MIYNSVSNLGLNPTVSDSSTRRIETFIFDFDSDVYGRGITVLFDHFSRPERKFPDKEALFAQIEQDCRNAREYRQ
jgi:riboflavin kinase/FMN adenylyltransferase